MPINYSQIRVQVSQFGEQASRRYASMHSVIERSVEALNQIGDRQEWISGLVDQSESRNRQLRCARPMSETLNRVIPLPQGLSATTLIAADGSQIIPNRHRQVSYGLINIASIGFQIGSNESPITQTDSQLLTWDALQLINGPSIQDFISIQRDLLERQALAKQAVAFPPPVITLTDGPLELFREAGDAALYAKTLTSYREILQGMQQHGTITAGYVDKPQSDLVNRLLRLVEKYQENPGGAVDQSVPETWTPDLALFNELLCNPGDRSATFGIQSPWNNQFEAPLRSCFFYINVSQDRKPYLARVELPFWCASDTTRLESLHVQIYHQCAIMGARPYPYILHRAHELALVTRDESDQLENMLAGELLTRGLEPGLPSHKQSAKDLPGRGRTK